MLYDKEKLESALAANTAYTANILYFLSDLVFFWNFCFDSYVVCCYETWSWDRDAEKGRSGGWEGCCRAADCSEERQLHCNITNTGPSSTPC